MDDKKTPVSGKTIEKDSFWIKVLVITIIVIWSSLVAGNWVGHYVAGSKILASHTSLNPENAGSEKSKHWKTVVNVDNQGNVEQGDNQTSSNDSLDVPDFRNIDNPIPGVDDQSIRTLGAPDSAIVEEKKEEKETVEDTRKEEGTSKSEDTSIEKEENTKKTETETVTEDKKTDEPAHRESPSDTKTPGPETTVQATKEPPKPTETPKPEKPSENAGAYDLQIGSFSKQENAQSQLDELQKKGYSATIEKVRDGDKEYFKVKLSDMGSREKASNSAEKLKSDGFDAIIISR